MTQTNRDPMEDPGKKRLEYVLKAGGVRLLAFAFGAIAVVCGTLATLTALGIGIFLGSGREILASEFPEGVLIFPVMILFFGLSVWSRRVFRRSAAAIPYVPPVREQLTALPADEVLLRGAGEPPSTPAELLRAAHEGTESAPEELLRSSNVSQP